MKKVLLGILGLLGIVGLVWSGIFVWNNFRGIGPIVKPPPRDISKDIPSVPSSGPQNLTNFPLSLPSGFSISIFAKDLQDPRGMIFDPNGTLLVSLTSAGKVVALPDRDKNGVADEIVTLVSGLNKPHGLELSMCKTTLVVGSQPEFCNLYIAETNQVAMWDYDLKNSTVKNKLADTRFLLTNKKKIIDLPTGGHFTRTLKLVNTSQGEKLLISVGSSCNVCNEQDSRRAKILIANPDGSGLESYATGLRNAVFMTTHPFTKKVWVTEMGRDLLGDDIPPDEINIIEEGKNYGWPICFGKNIHDDSFDKNVYKRNPCMEPFETPSFIDLPAHSAPLGLTFVPESWPKEYQYNLLVAYHGSWNRSVPTGYEVVRFKLDREGNLLSGEGSNFISGWLTKNGEALGRPVDLVFNSEGILFISDDKAGVIYRVSYGNKLVSTPKERVEGGGCKIGGCSGQVCSDKEVVTTCEYKAEYGCYHSAICERGKDGKCGWRETDELKQCLENARNQKLNAPVY